MKHYNRLIQTLNRLKKETEADYESASKQGSYQGQTIAGAKLRMLDEIFRSFSD